MIKDFAAEKWMPTIKIKETRKPQGEMITINNDGTTTSRPLGEEIVTIYECPCGKGTISATFDNMAGYRESYASIQCSECRRHYTVEYNWAGDDVPVLKDLRNIK